ncbi:MAG TPA: lysylphosphatidylglycerol synthase transmembrane domain-containing protein [Gemmatimonadaceae bacterium]|nr:lysylphosphatidylglycerol synthase transmembrane domain-containing protein [Gemmatimonadaceae bacterium]
MKNAVRNTLGVILSVALLAWALHNVEFSSVVEHLREANPWLFALAVVLGTSIFFVRAFRWRIILDPVAYHLPFGPLWRATAIGFGINNVTPRVGEIARAYALTRETSRVSFSASFASLAVDRVFDALSILLLMLVAMFDPAFPSNRLVAGQPIGSWLVSFIIVLSLAMVALYLIVLFPNFMIGLYEALARRVAPRFEARGREMLLSFASGLGVLRHPGRFASVLAWALIHWLLNALAYWVAFKAVGITAPFTAALLLQGLVGIGVALPSAPGFFGVFEYIGQQGLGIYGVDAARATSWAIGYHILTFIPITVIGIYYFVRLGLHFKDLRKTEADSGAVATASARGPGSSAAPEAPASKIAMAPEERA